MHKLLQLLHSRWLPFFEVLTIISFFQSLGRMPVSQQLQMTGSNNAAGAVQKSSAGRPFSLVVLLPFECTDDSDSFALAWRNNPYHIRLLIVSITISGTPSDVIRFRIMAECPFHLLSCSSWWAIVNFLQGTIDQVVNYKGRAIQKSEN